jgi:hypothetical protein
MKLKNLLLIASLFVVSSLHANPLVWHFVGHIAPGSTYNGDVLQEGVPFDFQILLNSNLVGTINPGQTEAIFFGPFESKVEFTAGQGNVEGFMITNVQNFFSNPETRGVTTVTVIWASGGGRQDIDFSSSISNSPRRLVPVPETPIPLVGPAGHKVPQTMEIFGPNGLNLIGNMDTFSATERTPEAGSTALLLALALVALGLLRTQAKQGGRKQVASH